jgi:hypothetical protein
LMISTTSDLRMSAPRAAAAQLLTHCEHTHASASDCSVARGRSGARGSGISAAGIE